MRRSSSLALALLAVTIAPLALAQSARSRGRSSAPLRGERRTTLTAIDPASLPAGTVPMPLDDTKKPASFAGMTEATEVQFVGADPVATQRWRSTGAGSIYGRLEINKGIGSFIHLTRDLEQNAYYGQQLSLTCTKDNSYSAAYRLLALRWERVSIDPSGASATLEIGDGWFDGSACKVFAERRTSLPLKVVHAVDGVPVVFAQRSEESLSFLFPPFASAVSDASSTSGSNRQLGALWRITVPVRKGSAASVLAGVEPTDAANWMNTLQGKAPEPRRPSYTAPRQMQIGIDVMQTVRDSAPSVLLRATL